MPFVPSEIAKLVPSLLDAFDVPIQTNVPSTALYHDEKFVPVMLATSALRVRAVVVVGMTEVAKAPSSNCGRPMRRVKFTADVLFTVNRKRG